MEKSTGNISVGARVAAISALLIASLVLLVALVGVFDGGGDSPSGEGSPASLADVPKRYEVKSGDTLSAIAAETGVSMSRIEELNPAIDPQALIAGQTLRLR